MKDKYGEWTVIGPSPNKKYYSRCQCSCGVVKDVNNSTLRLGKSISCGHDRGPDMRRKKYNKSNKKAGEKFGRLTVLKRINATGPSIYLCLCDCGKKVEVPLTALGSTRSCGCLKRDTSTKSMDKIKELGHEKIRSGQIDGTVVYQLDRKVSKNNTSGVKGVSKTKNNKYRAYINLRRKQIYLGVFDTIEEARDARLTAEKELYQPIKDDFKNKR